MYILLRSDRNARTDESGPHDRVTAVPRRIRTLEGGRIKRLLGPRGFTEEKASQRQRSRHPHTGERWLEVATDQSFVRRLPTQQRLIPTAPIDRFRNGRLPSEVAEPASPRGASKRARLLPGSRHLGVHVEPRLQRLEVVAIGLVERHVLVLLDRFKKPRPDFQLL